MTERMVIYLGENLDFVETEGLPKFIDERAYKLSMLPSEERFTRGDVLVWSQRSNDRFVYLGLLEDAFVDREARVLRFTCFRRLARPVVICGGDDDNRAELYAADKGFLNDFSYISEGACARVIEASLRPAKA